MLPYNDITKLSIVQYPRVEIESSLIQHDIQTLLNEFLTPEEIMELKEGLTRDILYVNGEPVEPISDQSPIPSYYLLLRQPKTEDKELKLLMKELPVDEVITYLEKEIKDNRSGIPLNDRRPDDAEVLIGLQRGPYDGNDYPFNYIPVNELRDQKFREFPDDLLPRLLIGRYLDYYISTTRKYPVTKLNILPVKLMDSGMGDTIKDLFTQLKDMHRDFGLVLDFIRYNEFGYFKIKNTRRHLQVTADSDYRILKFELPWI